MKHHSLFRRLLSVLLCLTMIFSLFPVSVFAEGVGETEQGDNDSVNLKIDYVSEDGAALAEAYNISVAKGAEFEGTVPFASVEGYRPAKVEFGAVNAANAPGEEGVISVYGACANVNVTGEGMVLSGAAEADVYVIVTYVALAAAVEEQPAEEQPTAEDTIKDAVKDALGTDTLALDDYAAAPLANKDNGSVDLEVGGKKELKGASSERHRWSSSNSNVATVSGTGKTGTVTAVAAGTATITHTYESWFFGYYEQTETWTVTVTEAEPTADTTTVYVYIRVGGNTDSISLPALNKDGWFTIGKVEVPTSVLPAAKESSSYATDANALKVAEYVKTSLQPHSSTDGVFDLTNTKWTGEHTAANGTMTAGLKTPTGATGYNDETGDNICWHLDGYLEIVEKHNLTVNYEFAQGSESSSVTLPESYTKSLPTGATETIDVPNYAGFTVAVTENGAPCHDTVTMGNKDRTVTVTYTRNAYTVVGTIDNGTVNEIANSDTLEVNHGENASLSFKAAEGYKIVSVTVNGTAQTVTDTKAYTYNNTSVTGDVTVAVKTEIDDSQTKTISYTVEYYKDGVKVEGDTQTVTKDVQVLEDTLTVKKDEINTTDKYEGYNFKETDPATIPETVTNGTVIKVYYTARTDLSYTVRYLEKDTNNVLATAKTVNNQKFGSTVTENAIEVEGYNKVDPTSATITIKETGNEINFYYVKRNNLSYTVNHILVNGTEETLYKPEVVNNQTFGAVINSADKKIAIPGYSFARADKETLTVGTGDNVINLYYTINTYTVKYVIEGDVGAADPYGTVESYDYNTEVTVAGAPEAKYGYSFSGWKTNDVSVSAAGKFNATKNVVFTGRYNVDGSQTKNLSATVDYKLGDEVQSNERIPLEATVQVLEPNTLTTESVTAKNFTGWKLDNIEVNGERVETLPATVNNGDAVVYNYVKDESKTQDTSYTVKHVTVLNGEETEQIADTKEYTGKAWINDKPAMIAIEEGSLAQKSYEGYIFSSMSVANDVAEVESGTVITLKYVKDESKTKNLTYTVQYFKDSVEADKDTVTKPVWVNDPDTLTVDSSKINTTNKYTGYKFDSEKTGTIPTTVGNGATINVYYVKDESQTKETIYTVRYTIEETEQTDDTKTYTGKAWVLDDPAQIAIAEGGIPAPADKYTGYKLDEKNPAYPAAGTMVNSGSVYTVNYVKDDSQTKETKYTVHYTINGVEQEKDKLEVTGAAWINDTNPQIAIAEGGIPAPEKKYTGYKLADNNPEYPAAGTLVNTGAEYTVNYVKDDNQTVETKYTVRHVVNGEEKASEEYTGKAWVNDSPAMIAIEAGSLDVNTYEGYKLDSITYADGKPVAADTKEVQTGTVITLTYIKDDGQTKGTSYTVKHIVAGVEQTDDTKTYTGTAWVNDTNPMIAIKEGSLAQNTYTGYKFDSMSVANGTTEVASGTVITLTYVKDESATNPTSYTVKHVVAGVEQTADTKTYTGTAWINDTNPMIAIEEGSLAENEYTGYKFTGMSVADNTKEVKSGTVITLTYVKDENWTKTLTYTVRHVTVNNGEKVQDTQTYEKKVWVNDPDTIAIVDGSLAQKSYKGYIFDSIDIAEGTTEVENETVITLKYVVDWNQTKDLKYTVQYYKGDWLEESSTVTRENVWINTSDMMFVNKDGLANEDKYEGYTFDRVEGPFGGTGNSYVKSGSTVNVYYKPNTDTKYTVIHHYQNILNDGYDIDVESVTETFTGVTDTMTSAQPKNKEGFTLYGKIAKKAIKGDGSSVVEIWYNRDKYTVTYQYEGFAPTDATDLPETVSYKHGAAVSVAPKADAYGYTFSGWDKTGEFTMPMENVTITGSFEPISGVSYTVRYVDEADTTLRAAEEFNDGVYAQTVTKNAPSINGYKLLDDTKATQSMTLKLDAAANVITFVYTKQSYTLTVNYVYAADGSEAASPVTQDFLYDTPYEVTSPVIPGYNVDQETVSGRMPYEDKTVIVTYTPRTDLTYIVNYLEEGTETVLAAPKTVANQTFGTQITETPVAVAGFVAPEAQTITIAVEDNVINFYYSRRTDLAYTVNYLEAGTNAVLAAPATVAGQTFGSTVTVNPIEIAGYATPDAQTVTIAVTGNVVNFYYAAIPVIPGNPVVDIPPIPQLPENIDDEITPLDGPQVTVDDPETIDDEATPLAAGEHLCCILHFLILCAALLIELIYISDSKKRQQKIFEMRRELNK